MDGWSWAWMTTAMVLFWGILAVALVALLRAQRSDIGQDRGSSAEKVLDERFARGEIDIDDYRQRRAALRERRPP